MENRLKIGCALRPGKALEKVIELYINMGTKRKKEPIDFIRINEKYPELKPYVMHHFSAETPESEIWEILLKNCSLKDLYHYDRLKISTPLRVPEKFWNKKTLWCITPFESVNEKLLQIINSIHLLHESILTIKKPEEITSEYFRVQIEKYLFSADRKEMERGTSKKDVLLKNVETIEKLGKISITAPVNFVEFIKWRIDLIRKMPKGKKTPGDVTLIAYNKFKNHVRDYEIEKMNGGKKDLPEEQLKHISLIEINDDIINDMLQWFSDRPTVTSVETVNSFKRQIGVHIRQAKKKNMAKRVDLQNEFLTLADSIKKDVYLTFSDLEKLKALKFDKEDADERRLEKIRDLFVVGCNCGYGWADLIGVYYQTDDDGKKYYFRTRRTKNGNMARVPVLDLSVIDILKKYKNDFGVEYSFQVEFNKKLPILIMRAKINRLEEIGRTNHKSGAYVKKKEELKDLVSSRSCRKTMASNAVRHYEKPLYIVQSWGAWENVDTLKYYISLSEEEIFEMDRKHSNMLDNYKKLEEENKKLKAIYMQVG